MSGRDPARPHWSLALATIAFSIAVICTSQNIAQPRQLREGDIGLKAFPVGLSIVLLIGGLIELARCIHVHMRPTGKSEKLAPKEKAAKGEPDRGTVYMLIALAGIAAYILSIPWIGFTLASAAFAVGAMVYLRTSLISAMVYSLVLIAIIHVLFVIVFKVQLPSGKLFADVTECKRVIVMLDVDSAKDVE